MSSKAVAPVLSSTYALIDCCVAKYEALSDAILSSSLTGTVKSILPSVSS